MSEIANDEAENTEIARQEAVSDPATTDAERGDLTGWRVR